MALTSEQKRRRKVSQELKKLPLKSLKDYEVYNEKCRGLSVPVKPAPSNLHEHVKVKFLRRDGMTHPIKMKFRNALIDFEKKIEHGHVYDIPKMVVKEYQDLGIPKYKQFINQATGESETVFSHKEPRFAFQIVFDE
jgi:hypothetical protein